MHELLRYLHTHSLRFYIGSILVFMIRHVNYTSYLISRARMCSSFIEEILMMLRTRRSVFRTNVAVFHQVILKDSLGYSHMLLWCFFVFEFAVFSEQTSSLRKLIAVRTVFCYGKPLYQLKIQDHLKNRRLVAKAMQGHGKGATRAQQWAARRIAEFF